MCRRTCSVEDFTVGTLPPTNRLSSVLKVHTTVYHVGALCTATVAQSKAVVKCGLKPLKVRRLAPSSIPPVGRRNLEECSWVTAPTRRRKA